VENRTRYAVLGALTLAPMSGYDLKRFADGSVAHFWTESYGQIYPILKQLLAEGLVTATGPTRRASRGRVVYGITDRGRKALRTWLAGPAEHQVGRVEVLLKLFFARNARPADALRLVRAFRAEHVARLAGYDAKAAALRSEHRGHQDLPYWLMTLSYGRRVSAALIAWADETLAALAKRRGA
jgi:DNA-binding PadR family transcriptional regulator